MAAATSASASAPECDVGASARESFTAQHALNLMGPARIFPPAAWCEVLARNASVTSPESGGPLGLFSLVDIPGHEQFVNLGTQNSGSKIEPPSLGLSSGMQAETAESAALDINV
eukprot:6195521-Pleurochrysis_carterae.AAC.12